MATAEDKMTRALLIVLGTAASVALIVGLVIVLLGQQGN